MTDGYYQCDKCGTFECGPLKRSPYFSSHDYADEEYRQITYGHRTGDDDPGVITRTIDLCEECRKALSRWIEDVDDSADEAGMPELSESETGGTKRCDRCGGEYDRYGIFVKDSFPDLVDHITSRYDNLCKPCRADEYPNTGSDRQ